MRSLSRFIKREYAELRNSDRKRRLQRQLSRYFNRPLRLQRAGSRGRDSIFLVRDKQVIIGAIRLCNPFLRRKPLSPDMPFVTLSDPLRLEREWQCYQQAAQAGLTPLPLWRDRDALMCEFLPGWRLSTLLARDPLRFWTLLCRASITLAAVHNLGITHMDASLANIIIDEDETRCRLIDFEYGPVANLDFAQQKAYDHLRLLESSIKFMPPGEEFCADGWLEELERLLSDEVRRVDIRPLVPAIGRVLPSPQLCEGLGAIFHKLGASQCKHES